MIKATTGYFDRVQTHTTNCATPPLNITNLCYWKSNEFGKTIQVINVKRDLSAYLFNSTKNTFNPRLVLTTLSVVVCGHLSVCLSIRLLSYSWFSSHMFASMETAMFELFYDFDIYTMIITSFLKKLIQILQQL